MRLALAAYPIERGAPEGKLAAWVLEAITAGASLLVFPEYAGVEGALPTGGPALDGAAACQAAELLAASYTARLAELAQFHGVWIIGGSLPCARDGKLVNAAPILGPTGLLGYQEKRILTPWERAQTPLDTGGSLTLLDLPWGRVATLLCYDSEFPLNARAATSQGAKLLLVPACTDTPHGAGRVRAAARARALEGGCLVAVAPLLGAVSDCDLVDANTGRAGVYAPPDAGFPPSGILAEGATDQPGWTIVDLPAATALRPRQVDVAGHWGESADPFPKVTVLPSDCDLP